MAAARCYNPPGIFFSLRHWTLKIKVIPTATFTLLEVTKGVPPLPSLPELTLLFW